MRGVLASNPFPSAGGAFPQQGVPGDAVPRPEREVTSHPTLFPQQGVSGDAVPRPEREVTSHPTLFPQQGVPGDAVPRPEREVTSHPTLFPRLPPAAADEKFLNSYYSEPTTTIQLE